MWITYAGSFVRPRTGCGARYGLSVSASSRSAGTRAPPRAARAFLYVTLPANETYQPRSSAGSSSAGDEKQWRTTVPRARRARERVVVGGAGVDDDRLAGARRERELPVEEPLLRVVRRVVAEVVEPGLAHRDRLRMREQRPHLAHAVRSALRLVGWMPRHA